MAQQPNPQAQRRFLALGQLPSRAALVFYPSFVKAFHWHKIGEVPALYEFFQSSLKHFLMRLWRKKQIITDIFPTVDFVGREYAILTWATIVNFVNGRLI